MTLLVQVQILASQLPAQRLTRMDTATIIATRLGFNEKCKAEAALYIRHSQDRLLVARFTAPEVFEILTELDMPCWEKLIGVAIRVDFEGSRIGHIVRDSWIKYQ